MKRRTKAIYKVGVLKPLAKLDLKEGEEVNIEISSAVKRTYGMFKVDPKTAKEIAETKTYPIWTLRCKAYLKVPGYS